MNTEYMITAWTNDCTYICGVLLPIRAWMSTVIYIMPRTIPDSKVHGANMGPNWGRQDPGGLHVGPMNFAIWDGIE